jgi:flagellar hook assembly protein FlgD
VFAVSGRTVANIPFSYTGGHEGVIEWNGKDDDGDNLANGTYLYRLEMNTPGGMLVSPMQRLVVMN